MMRGDQRIGEVRRAILAELEVAGAVDTRRWLADYPEIAEELLDFIVWLEPDDEANPNGWDDEGRVAEAALRMAYEQVKTTQLAELHRLSAELQGIRSQEEIPAPEQAPLQFRRAAVYAWTVGRLNQGRGRVSRLAAQKCVYMLEHALNLHLFEEHQRMRLGPYDSTARYKDAEPIARRKKWIVEAGGALRPGAKIAEVNRYAGRYLHSVDVAGRLVEILATLSDDELETLATVQAVAAELRKAEVEVSLQAVKHRIAGIPEWAGKLSRRNFHDYPITLAVQRLSMLELDEKPR